MFLIFLFVCFSVISNFSCRQFDVDSIRVKQRTNPIKNVVASHPNDTYRQIRSPYFIDHNTTLRKSNGTENVYKIYKPKEDPKLYYLSDSYRKKLLINKKTANEVAEVYPGKEVIEANDQNYYIPMRMTDSRRRNFARSDSSLCIKCPPDRTLISKSGSDHVLLQKPILFSCSGRRASVKFQFLEIFGPTFGSLVKEGSHTIMGQIMYKKQVIKQCNIQVHIITKSCKVPKYLRMHCNMDGKFCNFTCRNAHQKLIGESALSCKSDLHWDGNLPQCKDSPSCTTHHVPDNGRISCKGKQLKGGYFDEGTSCRVQCIQGWRKNSRFTVCHHGSWSKQLKCLPKRHLKLKRKITKSSNNSTS